jgi:hypothetical protein
MSNFMLSAHTLAHVAISLAGIFSGFVVLSGLHNGRTGENSRSAFNAQTVK